MGTILNTSDGGATWTSTVMGSGPQCHFPSICYYAYLYGVSFVDANTGWVAGGWQVCGGSCGGTSDLLSRTDDGGATWTRQTTPIAYGLHAVAFVDANTGWAVGGLGSIVHTTDGGATWTSQDSQTGNTLWALSFVNACRGDRSRRCWSHCVHRRRRQHLGAPAERNGQYSTGGFLRRR